MVKVESLFVCTTRPPHPSPADSLRSLRRPPSRTGGASSPRYDREQGPLIHRACMLASSSPLVTARPPDLAEGTGPHLHCASLSCVSLPLVTDPFPGHQ